MTTCARPGCGGTLAPTGYCDTCGRRPAGTGGPASEGSGGSFGSDPVTVPTGGGSEAESPPPTPPSSSTGDGEMSLPPVSVPDPSAFVIKDPRASRQGRRCGWEGCPQLVGVAFGNQPATSRGFCPRCGHPFDFSPQLHPGDRLNDQYEVVGCVAQGGLGWIYLARDHNLDGSYVALKGLINNNDATALSVATAERRFLTALQHDHIVRIRNFVTAGSTGYIVMEFINGRPLSALGTRDRQEDILGGPLRLEHVAVYGCRILNALEYLHQHGLLYCDMKPSNVIHHGDQITIIDLGAVRRMDDDVSPAVHTDHYLPRVELYPDEPGPDTAPTRPRRGANGAPPPRQERRRGIPRFSRLTDLYTVATTLEELARASVVPEGVAKESFDLVIRRATAPHHAARFATAAEMFEQLRGVWRQLRAEYGEQQAARSTLFAPGADLLDSGLASPPPPRHWLRPPGHEPPAIDPGRPPPDRVAAALPAPVPHPDHPKAARELLDCDTSLAIGETAPARAALVRACRELSQAVAHGDWRVAWYHGRLLLALGNAPAGNAEVHRVLAPALGLDPSHPRSAVECFRAVRQALPGETAPQLALGYCAESGGDLDRAEAFYRAVWRRDHADGSAAFGLARIRLARGERAAARAVLDQVPSHAPHHAAARIAAVRLLVGRLTGQQPTAGDFTEAQHRLPGLSLDGGLTEGDERLRLTAEMREAALHWAASRGWPSPGLAAGPLYGSPAAERRLRELLEESFTGLARRAATADEHAALIDHANHVRPLTLL
ncbi:tetratricopeptide repeat protein [Streptomyces sp. PT12]|uniref:tetratricopeptide repeat protein n=1 Tax=Streptomyces sp. PT12 TaxID=1510197 RepID=UPI000DE1D866|nr:tetratricopeptide repeat protein [Streptomyces sp. PT12]RBM07370.1 serine/threonine protein kinase [Streptomyces sp. PT12]